VYLDNTADSKQIHFHLRSEYSNVMVVIKEVTNIGCCTEKLEPCLNGIKSQQTLIGLDLMIFSSSSLVVVDLLELLSCVGSYFEVS